MKRIIAILSTIAVFAIVGTALAFKANFSFFVFVHDQNDARISACTKQVFAATLTQNAVPAIITRASIASTTAACPIVTVYRGE